jgi:succinoglycan biosynthesis transport protein ExoP
MSFNNEIDYLPNQPFTNAHADIEHKKVQKRKWQVLVATFLLLLISTNAVIWSQPPIYQSQAILHFSYSSQTAQEFSELSQQHIALHTRRVLSNSVLALVVEELQQVHGLSIDIQSVSEILSVQASLTGRIISLKATGEESQILKPILDVWVKVYLQLVETEKQTNNVEEVQVADQQLQLLEVKIIEQQQRLQEFAKLHNITSIERDENRILNKVKSLGLSLDEALSEEVQAKALLISLTASIENGESVIRPIDKTQIDAIEFNLNTISASLAALSKQYTQTYLSRDPTIVASQQEAKQLEILLAEQIQQSQDNYLQDVQRDLNTAQVKSKQLTEQLLEQDKLAQSFSQNLESFKRLDEELTALELQAQTRKSQQVAQEVSQPFDAKISLLEAPFIPDFAIGPNYQFNSIVSLLVASIVAVFALFLYGFIFKQKIAPNISSNFMVMPNQTGQSDFVGMDHNHQGQLPPQAPNSGQQTSGQLLGSTQTQVLLTVEECQSLFTVANNQGQALIGLVLSGVSLEELALIKKCHFSESFDSLQLEGAFSRQLTMSAALTAALQNLCDNLDPKETIWANLNYPQDFVELIINVAHDAHLTFTEQLSLQILRHTYLTFLVSQGIKLNDIEQIAGYTSPSNLARYRNLYRHQEPVELQKVETQFSFTKGV